MKKTRYVIEIGKGRSLDEIKDAVESDMELIHLLVGDVSAHDMRATFVDDSFKVEEFTKEAGRGRYTMDFSYDWDAYYGCRDMCRSDNEQDAVSFRYWGGRLIFEIIHPEVEARSPDEEF